MLKNDFVNDTPTRNVLAPWLNEAADRIVAVEEGVEETASGLLDLVPIAEKGAPNGVATLDGTGHVPDDQIAAIIARTSDIADAVAALVDASPSTLNTLKEFATALGNDPNFATTITTLIGAKADAAATTAALATKADTANVIPLTQRGAANGVATLDADAKVPVNQLPVTVGGVQGVVVARTVGQGTHIADGTSGGNTAAIQAALNSLVGAQAPVLYIREGIYAGLGQITLPDIPNLRIVAEGKDKVTLRFAGLTTACLVKATPLTFRYKWHFSGFTIDNLSKATVGGVAFAIENLSNCTFTDLVITNVETALALKGASYFNRFIDVDIEEVVYGETFAAGSGGAFPNENLFLGVKHTKSGGGSGVDYPVRLLGGNDNHWIACSFEDFLVGLDLSDIGNTFTNCRIESNDRGAAIYARFNAGANNNGILNCYFSGNGWTDRATSIVDNGTGNSIVMLSSYKDQLLRAERNAVAADTLVEMKRSGSGDAKGLYSAEDTYAASGAPISYIAKHVRAAGKYVSGLLSGVEKWWVGADGSSYQAGTLNLDNLGADPSANPASGSLLWAISGALKYRGTAGDGGSGGNRFLHNRDVEVIAAGTAYTLTNAMASVAFGTTSPSVAMPSVGTYVLLVAVQIDFVGATIAQGDHYVTVKLRNTSDGVDLETIRIPLGTLAAGMATATGQGPAITFPVRFVASGTKTVAIQAQIDATPSAGSVRITAAKITGQRLF